MINGYGGFYKNIYLRSSLEFAYAYYLDFKKIEWKYEYKAYQLTNRIYKPDFFIFNKGNLIKIVEIKGKENKEDGIQKIKEFKELYNISIELVEYKDILKLYQNEMPIRYHKAKKMFIDEYGAKLSEQNMQGANNPMYGIKHSNKTKKIIGKKCRERFQNKVYMENFKKSISKRTYKKGYIKTKREKRVCPICKNEFEVKITSSKIYCSNNCFHNSSFLKQLIKEGRKIREQEYLTYKEEIKKIILDWAINNKELVLNTKFNKINSTLSELYSMLYEKYDIKDERSVSKIFDTTSRKEFLKILKEILINS